MGLGKSAHVVLSSLEGSRCILIVRIIVSGRVVGPAREAQRHSSMYEVATAADDAQGMRYGNGVVFDPLVEDVYGPWYAWHCVGGGLTFSTFPCSVPL